MSYDFMSQIDDWRDIAFCWDYTKPARLRMLGANSVVTGFGNEYKALSSTDALSQKGFVTFSPGVLTYHH